MVDNERENAAEGRNHVFVPQYRSGGCTVRGIRQTLEDALICVDDLHDQLQSRGAFYGVFDGHDGAAAALYAKDNLLSFILQDSLFRTSVEEAVKKEFLRLDRDFLEACQRDNNLHSGTTALIALLQARNLLVANAGDCRAVLCRRGQAVPLSSDHAPNSEGEKMRIELAGGTVTSDGYVNGHVTVARAIGDWHMPGLKGLNDTGPVIAEPEIKTWELSEDDEFLLMGCDGLWDVFTNEAAIIFARRQLRKHNDPERCSKALVREALKRNAQDNITVITVCFQADAPPDLAVVETRSTTRKINLESMLSLQDHLDIAQESRRSS
ncbi:hypothetical protein M758_UG143200 [Ceratodon purpureus]|nr:hypothetical protein M758_UG143200 [Ceratodon purpureus]